MNIPGVQGIAGTNGTNGTNGVNAYTLTTADFVVPNALSNVTISVINSAPFVIGQTLIIGQGGGVALANPGPGSFKVVSIPGASSLQVEFQGYAGDVSPGATISSGAVVSPLGAQLIAPLGIASGGTGQITAAAAARALTTRLRLLASLIGANMNTTGDQAITGLPVKWLPSVIICTNASTNLTTAAGGIYTAAAKGGTVIVPASQVYTALTASGKFKNLTLDTTAGGPTTDVQTATTIYLSLTTPQGGAATADIYFFGYDLT